MPKNWQDWLSNMRRARPGTRSERSDVNGSAAVPGYQSPMREDTMSIVAPTATRVEKHTASAINRRIRLETYARLECIGHRRAAIQRRLEELDQEWDIERAIQLNAASLILAGTVLGMTV